MTTVVVIDGVTPMHAVVNVTAAGTPVPLSATSLRLSSPVSIRARDGNTGVIYVGGSAVSSSNGYVLAKSESVQLAVRDLSAVFIDAGTSGDGVTYLVT